MEIEIRGIKFFLDDDGSRPWIRLAHAEICLKDEQIVVRDVLLSWSKLRGFRALAPLSNPTSPAISWNIEGEWAKALAGQIADMWERMGGKLPEGSEPTEQEQTAFNAVRRIAEKRQAPKAEPEADDEGADAVDAPTKREMERALTREAGWSRSKARAGLRAADMANDTEAIAGLHRTLSVEAEEAARACG